MQQIGGGLLLLSVAIVRKSKFYKYSRKGELLEVQGTGAPTLGGRVTGPLGSGSSPFSFDDVHQIEALSKLPGRVVPLFRAAAESLDLGYYKILTSHKIAADRREVSSPYLLRICGNQIL